VLKFVDKDADFASSVRCARKNARLQKLPPDTLAFDMAVNIFVYQSGTALPFVETHTWSTD